MVTLGDGIGLALDLALTSELYVGGCRGICRALTGSAWSCRVLPGYLSGGAGTLAGSCRVLLRHLPGLCRGACRVLPGPAAALAGSLPGHLPGLAAALSLVRPDEEVALAGTALAPEIGIEFSFRNFSESRKAPSTASLVESQISNKLSLLLADRVSFQVTSQRTNMSFRVFCFFSSSRIFSELRPPLVSRIFLALPKQAVKATILTSHAAVRKLR